MASLDPDTWKDHLQHPYIPGHAMVFGWLKPINTGPGPQLADPFCPRMILKNVVEYVV